MGRILLVLLAALACLGLGPREETPKVYVGVCGVTVYEPCTIRYWSSGRTTISLYGDTEAFEGWTRNNRLTCWVFMDLPVQRSSYRFFALNHIDARRVW
jgi:hypothetical protein